MKAWAVAWDWKNIFIVYRKRWDSEDFSLPKGHQENWETLEETALRETQEETGIQGEILWKIDSINYSYIEDWISYDCEVHFYALKIIKREKKTAIDDVTEVLSYPLDKVYNQLSYKTDKQVLKKREKEFLNK